MTETRSFASLGPSLLARKGGARPAMRPQLQPMHHFHEATARQFSDDLGWNDMGHDVPPPSLVQEPAPAAKVAEVVALNPDAALLAEVPAVLRQREEVAALVAVPPAEPVEQRPRTASERRAAFTLRLDAERHLKLRLASALGQRSAQNIVTDALDRLLESLPDVTELAAQARKGK